jgi:8-oxo-dGTP diphosphatase
MSESFSVAGVARVGDSVFIMRRLPGGSVGGKWEFPGGKSETGESAETTLIREWYEETGLDVNTGKELARCVFHHNGRPVTLIAFEVFLPEPASVPQLRDHDAYQWIDYARINEVDMVDSDRMIADLIVHGTA